MSEQGTEQWFADRAGRITGSRFVGVMARGKKNGLPLKDWHDLAEQLATERINGHYNDSISAPALEWGTIMETPARGAYEILTGNIVQQTGFIVHPVYPFAGCSPDGLIGADGMAEFKCPKDQRIHLRRWREGMEQEYIPQCQGALWVKGRAWIDWCSYDPRAPEKARLYVKRLYRDEAYIADLAASVMQLEAEIKRIITETLEAIG